MIRRATLDDAYTLARMRTAMVEEMQAAAERDPTLRERSYAYFYEMLEKELLVGWLLEEAGRPVAMASLLIHHHPPRPHGERKRGYVTALYVEPEHRRQGFGRQLMDVLMAYGREQGLQRLELRTTPAGRPLYETLGFKPQEVLMLNLDEGSQR